MQDNSQRQERSVPAMYSFLRNKVQDTVHVFQYCGFGQSTLILLTIRIRCKTLPNLPYILHVPVRFSTVQQSADLCAPSVAHPESLVLDPALENILDLNPDVDPIFNPWTMTSETI
jgi:hypothetical protein